MQALDPLNDYLPHLDMMIKAIQNERYDALYEQYAELDQIYGMLYGTYIEELQYLAADDPHNSVAEQIGEQFLQLRPYIQALHDDLSLREFSEAVGNLEKLKELTLRLFSLFAEYKRVAASGETYSDIPYTQELIRVCRHYLEGELALEAVHGRLDIFCKFHELLESQISTLVPSPPERKTFEERLPDLHDALEIQMHAIEDLDLALERGDNELLEETLEQLVEAAEVLVEIYKALQKADLEPRKICCVRCGADNSIESKLCGACGAVLPQSAGIGTPISTIALEEDGSHVANEESEEVARMRALVDAALAKSDPGELLDAISDYRARWDRNQRKFEGLDDPPADLTGERLTLLNKARTTFGDAMLALQESMQLLEDGATVLDLGLMEAGLTRMQEGEHLFRDFAKDFERAQEMEG